MNPSLLRTTTIRTLDCNPTVHKPIDRHILCDRPQRTTEYIAEPGSRRYRECLFEWLAAHAPLWNQLTSRRRQAYFGDDGDVWDVEYTDLSEDYAPILGKAACQQVARKNSEAWQSHFRLLEQYHNDADSSVTEKPSPPGYWGNRDEGSELHGLVRNDLYTFDWGEDRSTLEFGVGDVLKDKYNFEYQERVTLELRASPQWNGDDSRLELVSDEAADTLRVKYPVRIRPERLQEQRLDAVTHTLDTENTTHTAAIDGGANNTLAIVTSQGDTAVSHTCPECDEFQELSGLIGERQSELPDNQYTSKRVQRVSDKRRKRRDHSRDAAVKHAADWLLERTVDTVSVGDLTDVLGTHWSATVTEKTHNFWSHRQLGDRLELTLGDAGITVEQVSDADSSSQCPECGSETVTHDGEEFCCQDCELDAHSDVAGAWNLSESEGGPMARPVALSADRERDPPREGAYWEWNGHDWTPSSVGDQSRPVEQPSISEPARSQPGESTGRIAHGGIPRLQSWEGVKLTGSNREPRVAPEIHNQDHTDGLGVTGIGGAKRRAPRRRIRVSGYHVLLVHLINTVSAAGNSIGDIRDGPHNLAIQYHSTGV